MKRVFLICTMICTMMCMFGVVTFSQLKVTQDGKVAIGLSSTPISNLAVGHAGNPYMRNYFYSDVVNMQVYSTGNSPYVANYWGTAIRAYTSVSSQRGDIGIECGATNAAPSPSGRAIGITSTAADATSGYNYAVLGNLGGSNNGAAIYGTMNNVYGLYVDGRYAGYFDGNVKVTGTINGTFIGNSDIRFKKNVTELGISGSERGGVLKDVISLIPISYNYKQEYYDLKDDTLKSPIGHFDEKSNVFQKKHFGLIAQDLQLVYPDLVYENDNGYLSINYVEIIPLLIQSIKELKEEVDLLSAAAIGTRSSTSNDILSETPNAVLYQNAPNPFTERTVIKFDLPEKTISSYIYIFNMQGSLVKQITVGSSQQSVTISGSELNAGMYLYSLIVDGKEIDTKRMILTK